MKKISLLVFSLVALMALPTFASGNFLKDLKKKAKEEGKKLVEKGKESVKSAVNEAIPVFDGSITNSESSASGVGRTVGSGITKSTTSGTSYQKRETKENWGSMNAAPEEIEEIPVAFSGLHVATIHSAYANTRNYSRTPKETSSTVHIVLNDENPKFSDFYDGVAYVNSSDGSFYINERGEKLFDSEASESDIITMPRFCNGVVLEQPHYRSKNTKVKLRDKQGNVIKEFDGKFCSNIVDGIGVVLVKNPKSLNSWDIRYIDTKGNFVFNNLTSTINSSIMSGAEVKSLARKQSEGLTAFAKYDNKSETYLWGFRDAGGNIVVEPKYIAVRDFHDGMAAFCVPGNNSYENRWGFIDKSGREVIPASFSIMPSDFDSGMSRVITKNDEAYLIDKNGNKKHGPFSRFNTDKEGGLLNISPFFNGHAIMEVETNISDDPSYPIFKSYTCLVDANLNKKSWADERRFMSDLTPLSYSDGKIYFRKDTGYRNIACIDESNMDVVTPYLDSPYVNGYSRYGTPNGYINEDFEFAIIFEKNEF